MIVESVGPELWEVAKGVMIALTTLGVGYLIRTDRNREIRTVELEREVFDRDGDNGLKRKMGRVKTRLDSLEAWRIQQDTIDAIEEEQRQEVGRGRERLRDKLHPPVTEE